MKIFLVLISTFAFSAQAEFSTMTCKKVISDELKISVKKSGVAVQWRTRGGEDAVALLRTVADEKIPTSLLEGYGDIFVEFTVPVKACDFSAERLGHFSCDWASRQTKLPFVIKARLSPYGEKPYDVYKGNLDALTVASEFYGDAGKRYLKFPMGFKVAGTEVPATSAFFFAHFWESEGYRQNPSCQVDNQYLVDKE